MAEGAGQWQGKWIKKATYFNLSTILKSSVTNFLVVDAVAEGCSSQRIETWRIKK